MPTLKKLFITLLILLVLPSLCGAATYYVKKGGHDASCDGGTDQTLAGKSGDGDDCAFLTIQHALDTATTAGDIINVGDGT